MVKIGFNELEYNRFKALEDKAEQIYNHIVQQALEVLNIPNAISLDKEELLKQPSDYIVDKYRELYLSNRPSHLDFRSIFENETGVTLHGIDSLNKELQQIQNKMGAYSPTITNKGFKRNIKKSSFDVFLDESKQKHYNALNNLIDAITALDEYRAVNYRVNIIRSVGADRLNLLSDGSLTINTETFKK